MLAADYDRDGRLDLVALPGPRNDQSSMQVFHNETASPGGMLHLHLLGDPNAQPPSPTPIGSRVTVTAQLDGLTPKPQYLELRAGENHGTTTNSLAMEVGVGLHPSATAISIRVDWPNGLSEDFSYTPLGGVPLNEEVVLTQGMGAAVSIPLWTLGAMSATAGDAADASVPIKVKLEVATNASSIASSELTLCPQTVNRWLPVAMDHETSYDPQMGAEALEFEVSPLRFPVLFDTGTVTLQPSILYARVRTMSRDKQVVEALSTSSSLSIPNQPETRPFDSASWGSLTGGASFQMVAGVEVLELPPAATASALIAFPGETTSADYHLIIEATNLGSNSGELTITCPSVNQTVTFSGYAAGVTSRTHQVLELAPYRGGPLQLVVGNTGTETMQLTVMQRGRRKTNCFSQ